GGPLDARNRQLKRHSSREAPTSETRADQDFSAETEGFEPSVPLRELHLSRVKTARVAPLVETDTSLQIHAEFTLSQAISGPRLGGRKAHYPLQNRNSPRSPHARGPLV